MDCSCVGRAQSMQLSSQADYSCTLLIAPSLRYAIAVGELTVQSQ